MFRTMKRTLPLYLCLLLASMMCSCTLDYATDVGSQERYGCFRITGIVAGNVLDGQQVLLEGMKVTIDYGSDEIRTVYTGKDGTYMSEFYTSAYADNRLIRVTVSDEDGMENGFYATVTKDINHSSASGFVDGDGRNFVGTKTIVMDFLLDISGRMSE